MSPDPFFSIQTTGTDDPPPCNLNCPASGAGRFCGAFIDPACLRIGGDGSVRVGLSVSPRMWFATLPQLGSVLHLARNPVAVLGEFTRLPRVINWRNTVLPRDNKATFMPNLAEHAGICAVRELTPAGVAHGFEVTDARGFAFQRIALTSPAHRDLYEEFVTNHQSPPEQTSPWFSPNHAWSAKRCAGIMARMDVLRSRQQNNTALAWEVPVDFVSRVLDAVMREQLKICTTHFSRGLVRSTVWTPTAIEPMNPASLFPEFFHGADVGLHFNSRAAASVWIATGCCEGCGQDRWSVEVADAANHVGLVIAAGGKRLESRWRQLLRLCLV